MLDEERSAAAGPERPAAPVFLRASLSLAIALVTVACLSVLAPPRAAAGGGPEPPELGGPPGRPVPGLTPGSKGAWTAKPLIELAARTVPGGGKAKARIATRTRYTNAGTVLLVTAGRYDSEGRLWLEVALPVRPTGSRGWIRAAGVSLKRTPWSIRVSVSKRRVYVYRSGRRVRTMPAVVGRPSTPTPRGLFAVYERARMADPRGFLGPWALHLTAFSEVLFRFGAGDGQVAIHGRGPAALVDPLGSARSNGCIRLRNRDIEWLRRRAGAGTPVLIEP